MNKIVCIWLFMSMGTLFCASDPGDNWSSSHTSFSFSYLLGLVNLFSKPPVSVDEMPNDTVLSRAEMKLSEEEVCMHCVCTSHYNLCSHVEVLPTGDEKFRSFCAACAAQHLVATFFERQAFETLEKEQEPFASIATVGACSLCPKTNCHQYIFPGTSDGSRLCCFACSCAAEMLLLFERFIKKQHIFVKDILFSPSFLFYLAKTMQNYAYNAWSHHFEFCVTLDPGVVAPATIQDIFKDLAERCHLGAL